MIAWRALPLALLLGWAVVSSCAAQPAVAAAAASGTVDSSALPVRQVAPGVYVHDGLVADWLPVNRGEVANLGFVVGSRCVAVIDTGGTPAEGERLRAAVRATTPLPVCYVVNTHAHPDHVLGNGAFATPDAAAPRFVAASRFPAALSAREPYFRNALKRDFGIAMKADEVVYPTLLVEPGKPVEIDLGDRLLQLEAWPTAHTDNDLTVYDRQTRSLFLSDLLFIEHLPVVDGSLKGWLAVLDRLAGFDVALAIPGHGAPATRWPGALQAERDYLRRLLQYTREALREKRTLQQTVDTVGRDDARWLKGWALTERFHKRNVTAAYAELEWEE